MRAVLFLVHGLLLLVLRRIGLRGVLPAALATRCHRTCWRAGPRIASDDLADRGASQGTTFRSFAVEAACPCLARRTGRSAWALSV